MKRLPLRDLLFLATLTLMIVPSVAMGQSDDQKPVPPANQSGLPPTAPANALGRVSPIAEVPRTMPVYAAQLSGMLSYVASQVSSELPRALLRGQPDLNSVYGLQDQKGPVAFLIPAKGVTADTLANPPAVGLPVGWLFLRYATLPDPPGQVPEARIAHLVFPGPMRITVLPLRAVRENGQLKMTVIGLDDQPLYARTLTPAADALPIALGAPATGAGSRDVTVSFPGYTSTIGVGIPAAVDMLPRPEVGALNLGDLAPDFDLKTMDGGSSIRLSASKEKQPVVLVFGSYT